MAAKKRLNGYKRQYLVKLWVLIYKYLPETTPKTISTEIAQIPQVKFRHQLHFTCTFKWFKWSSTFVFDVCGVRNIFFGRYLKQSYRSLQYNVKNLGTEFLSGQSWYNKISSVATQCLNFEFLLADLWTTTTRHFVHATSVTKFAWYVIQTCHGAWVSCGFISHCSVIVAICNFQVPCDETRSDLYLIHIW